MEQDFSVGDYLLSKRFGELLPSPPEFRSPYHSPHGSPRHVVRCHLLLVGSQCTALVIISVIRCNIYHVQRLEVSISIINVVQAFKFAYIVNAQPSPLACCSIAAISA